MYLREKATPWADVSLHDVTNFIAWLQRPPSVVRQRGDRKSAGRVGRSAASINATIGAVSAFYQYHTRSGAVRSAPTDTGRAGQRGSYKPFLTHVARGGKRRGQTIQVAVPQKEPKTLTTAQVDTLVGACSRLRDQFLVRLLQETGMRIGQALGLYIEDVVSWDNRIKIVYRTHQSGIRGKTREPYWVDVPMSLMALFARYIVDEYGDTARPYVFVNLWNGRVGEPMAYASAIDLFDRLSKKTGIEATPHMLRHTHATELIRAGWDPAMVQKRLGHTSVQTTLNRYVHLNDEDMKAAYSSYLKQRQQEATG